MAKNLASKSRIDERRIGKKKNFGAPKNSAELSNVCGFLFIFMKGSFRPTRPIRRVGIKRSPNDICPRSGKKRKKCGCRKCRRVK